ncbi:hypothetical protein HQ563_09900 [bacterium]|nr:hypothetical protein [bacterium]
MILAHFGGKRACSRSGVTGKLPGYTLIGNSIAPKPRISCEIKRRMK